MKVELATEADLEWIKPVHNANKNILAEYDGRNTWTALNDPKKQNWLIVVRPYAFARFYVRKDGTKTLFEIAVREDMKRKGIAKLLLDYIGRPVNLKTDADNEESNAFYRALGFVLLGRKTTAKGKPVNIYQGF
jgi:ribosomal protein S18 acetylase RimI-like enzyme